MVVGLSMLELSERFKHLPDIFYSQRIQYLVGEGVLLSQGNLKRMGYSEIKLPANSRTINEK